MRDISEKQWQEQVLDVAARYGWRTFHWPDSRRVTAPGWPDLSLLKGDRLLFAELKTRTGRLSTEQRVVLAGLIASGQEVAVWRPADLVEVIRILGPVAARPVPPTL